MRKKHLVKALILMTFLSAYPTFVLGYTWVNVFQSDLEGGRHGPLDAYRHALASSVLSYTFGENAVAFVSNVMESGNKESNKMDIHNNQIGARIGAKSESFFELEAFVHQAVLKGGINTHNPDQITWLEEEKWNDQKIW